MGESSRVGRIAALAGILLFSAHVAAAADTQSSTRKPQEEAPSAPAAPAMPASPPAREAAPPKASVESSAVATTNEGDASFQTTVTKRRPITAASSTTVRDRDFLLRPHQRPADILTVAPGLYIVQHAGGGKANQYFLRGFDADHGTDVAITIDGIPVNMVSHGHGQGYADMNWLIPEIAERVEVFKGPYFAQHGDFTTAGAVNVVTRRSFEQSQASLSAGMFRTFRGFVASSPKLDGWTPLLAFDVSRTNGPFINPEAFTKFNLFSKITRDLDPHSTLTFALTAYGGGWNASGQIPLREVDAGRLDRFGSEDPSEGGNSQRHNLYAMYKNATDDGHELSLLGYVTLYRLNLYSNFTFFSDDPVNGDGKEFIDNRTMLGMKGSYRMPGKIGEASTFTTLGLQLRNDNVTNGIRHVVKRKRIGTLLDNDVSEGSLAAYAEEDTHWANWFRTVMGLRADYFGFTVTDRQETQAPGAAKSSGVADALQFSPKANFIFTPVENLDLYANAGMGFHSNDARGIVKDPGGVTPLARAYGYELGTRTRLAGDRVDLSASLFRLDLDSELVFVGDDGTTDARGPTRRQGIEIEARFKLVDWGPGGAGVFADTDLTFTKAAFTRDAGNGTAVALAPTRLVSAGVSVRHPSGFYGRLAAFHIGDRPATEDGFLTADGFVRFDATVGYRQRSYELSVAFQNLFNTKWREAQFANVSRLPNETGPSSCPSGTRPKSDGQGNFKGCEDVHFTPGAPFNVQATASVFF